MTTLFEVLHRNAEPYKIKLVKGQKDTYGWEITVSAGSITNCIEWLRIANTEMKANFGGGEHT